MKPLFRSLFGAILAAAITTQSQASTEPFQGVVLVPPAKEIQAPAGHQALDFKRGKVVDFATTRPIGTIVVLTRQHALYLVIGNGKAVKYRIATAKPGFEWSGSHKVSAKSKWPDWRPPEEMRRRRPELPAFMAGGPDNPLGARAIYLGSSIYRIHGTNEPDSIGKSASSGCIRMLNADIMELFANTRLGALVVVM
jgi:lipoprotein-anchoring transpeptidase ErfK/SrfK